jgi:tetratricopeptide (TPR) repeat protein
MGALFKFFYEGVEKYNSGDYKGAIVDFDKEIDCSSGYSETHIYRGYAKYRIGDKDGALLDWLKAAELGDNRADKIIDRFFN